MDIIFLTLKIATISTIFSLIIGILLIFIVYKYNKLANIIDLIMTFPMVVSPTVIGFFVLQLFGNNSILGQLLNSIGIKIIFTVNGAILTAFLVSVPLLYMSIKTGVEKINRDVILSAKTLGISNNKIFFKILLPQVKSSTITGIILAFSRAMGEFGATMLVAGNIVGKTQTISLKIYTLIQSGNYTDAYLWILILLSITSILIWILNLLSKERKYENKH